MLIPFNKTEKIKTAEATIWDYPVDDSVGISYQKLTGQGPRQGFYLNKVCHEIYFIISGSATFTVNDDTVQVSEKDVVVVPENTPHSIETEIGETVTYITITRPDWFEDQSEIVKQ